MNFIISYCKRTDVLWFSMDKPYQSNTVNIVIITFEFEARVLHWFVAGSIVFIIHGLSSRFSLLSKWIYEGCLLWFPMQKCWLVSGKWTTKYSCTLVSNSSDYWTYFETLHCLMKFLLSIIQTQKLVDQFVMLNKVNMSFIIFIINWTCCDIGIVACHFLTQCSLCT